MGKQRWANKDGQTKMGKQRLVNNTIVKTKEQTAIYKAIYRKLKIKMKQHEPHYKTG